jgi:hypothetical protein
MTENATKFLSMRFNRDTNTTEELLNPTLTMAR